MALVIVFAVFLIIIYFIIEIGAIALRMTGLDEDTAWFQAVSAFTTSGFTTREAELVVTQTKRRKIVIALMLIGAIVMVTLITFSLYLVDSGNGASFRAIAGAIVAVFIVFLFRKRRMKSWIDRRIENQLSYVYLITPAEFQELVHEKQGMGVARVAVNEKCPFAGKRLRESGLREIDIIVLTIERKGIFISMPKARNHIYAGDKLICYGNLKNIREMLAEGCMMTPKETPQRDEAPHTR